MNDINNALERFAKRGLTADREVKKHIPPIEEEMERQVSIYSQNGQVFVDFGSKIRWLRLTSDQALQFATHLIDEAEKC